MSTQYQYGFGEASSQFLLYEGSSEQPARALIAKAGTHNSDLHEEIYVFDSGFWFKDHSLWVETQKASWDDIILKEEFKTSLQKDVFGFFDSEELYKNLGIPWKVRAVYRNARAAAYMHTERHHHAWPAWSVLIFLFTHIKGHH